MILVDTGPIVAALNRRDLDHARCRKLLAAESGNLLVTPYVVAEGCWMAASRISAHAEASIIRSVAAKELQQVVIESADMTRIDELLCQFADLHAGMGLGLADASTVAVAERLRITEIATLDKTDFSIVRPHGKGHFDLLP